MERAVALIMNLFLFSLSHSVNNKLAGRRKSDVRDGASDKRIYHRGQALFHFALLHKIA